MCFHFLDNCLCNYSVTFSVAHWYKPCIIQTKKKERKKENKILKRLKWKQAKKQNFQASLVFMPLRFNFTLHLSVSFWVTFKITVFLWYSFEKHLLKKKKLVEVALHTDCISFPLLYYRGRLYENMISLFLKN